METTLQRTPEWFSARLGKLTGSRADKAFDFHKIGAHKGEPKESAHKLALELAYERTTGNRIEVKPSLSMLWGIEHEDEARLAYIEATGSVVNITGFIDHPSINNFGASPDGLIQSEQDGLGILEIKCPNELTHIERILSGIVPKEYKAQMLVEMLCVGAKWADFVDYDPRNILNPLFIVRYTPSDEDFKNAEKKAVAFLALVDEKVAKLEQYAEKFKEQHPKEIWDALEEDEIKE